MRPPSSAMISIEPLGQKKNTQQTIIPHATKYSGTQSTQTITCKLK